MPKISKAMFYSCCFFNLLLEFLAVGLCDLGEDKVMINESDTNTRCFPYHLVKGDNCILPHTTNIHTPTHEALSILPNTQETKPDTKTSNSYYCSKPSQTGGTNIAVVSLCV